MTRGQTELLKARVARERADFVSRGVRHYAAASGMLVEEVRGSEGLPPGAYWALLVVKSLDEHWLELQRARPSLRGVAAVGCVLQPVKAPSGKEALNEAGELRAATPEERRSVGDLAIVRATAE